MPGSAAAVESRREMRASIPSHYRLPSCECLYPDPEVLLALVIYRTSLGQMGTVRHFALGAILTATNQDFRWNGVDIPAILLARN